MASRRKTRVIRDRREPLSVLTSVFWFAGVARVGPDRRVRPSSPLVGRSLRDARFSLGTVVASMSRDGEMLFPHADTALLARDVFAVVTEPHQASRVRAIADGYYQDAFADEDSSALEREVTHIDTASQGHRT